MDENTDSTEKTQLDPFDALILSNELHDRIFLLKVLKQDANIVNQIMQLYQHLKQK